MNAIFLACLIFVQQHAVTSVCGRPSHVLRHTSLLIDARLNVGTATHGGSGKQSDVGIERLTRAAWVGVCDGGCY